MWTLPDFLRPFFFDGGVGLRYCSPPPSLRGYLAGEGSLFSLSFSFLFFLLFLNHPPPPKIPPFPVKLPSISENSIPHSTIGVAHRHIHTHSRYTHCTHPPGQKIAHGETPKYHFVFEDWHQGQTASGLLETPPLLSTKLQVALHLFSAHRLSVETPPPRLFFSFIFSPAASSQPNLASLAGSHYYRTHDPNRQHYPPGTGDRQDNSAEARDNGAWHDGNPSVDQSIFPFPPLFFPLEEKNKNRRTRIAIGSRIDPSKLPLTTPPTSSRFVSIDSSTALWPHSKTYG